MEYRINENDPTLIEVINERPVTPNDLNNLDKLNEEYLKQNPPKPFAWSLANRYQSHSSWFFNSLIPKDKLLERPVLSD